LALLAAPVWWQASRALRAREFLRDESLKAFDRLRQSLIMLARGIGLDPETLWMLTDEEVSNLDSGWRPSSTFLDERRREIRYLAQCRLPNLVRRNDDFDTYYQDPVGLPSPLRGVSLTRGDVIGRAWVRDEPAALPPESVDGVPTILVARSIDAGWTATLLQVAGVIVEIGGDLCHGSIILRETGLPAIAGVANATRFLRDGDLVRLRAGAGIAELVGVSGEDSLDS
jgi:pyruvate,water dikinase